MMYCLSLLFSTLHITDQEINTRLQDARCSYCLTLPYITVISRSYLQIFGPLFDVLARACPILSYTYYIVISTTLDRVIAKRCFGTHGLKSLEILWFWLRIMVFFNGGILQWSRNCTDMLKAVCYFDGFFSRRLSQQTRLKRHVSLNELYISQQCQLVFSPTNSRKIQLKL